MWSMLHSLRTHTSQFDFPTRHSTLSILQAAGMSYQDPNLSNIRVPLPLYTLPDPSRGINQRSSLLSPATRPDLASMQPKSPLPATAPITLPVAHSSLSEHEKGKCEYLMSRLVEYGYPLVALTSIADTELRDGLVACLGQLLGDRVKLWRRVEELVSKNDALQMEIGGLQRRVTEHRENMLAAVKKAEEQDSRYSLQLKERDEREKGLRARVREVERELTVVKRRDAQYKVECRKWESRCNDLQEKLQRLLASKTKDSISIEWLPVKAQGAGGGPSRTRAAQTLTTNASAQPGSLGGFTAGNGSTGTGPGMGTGVVGMGARHTSLAASSLPSSLSTSSTDMAIHTTIPGTGSHGTLTAPTIPSTGSQHALSAHSSLPSTGSLHALTSMLYDTHLHGSVDSVDAALGSLPKPDPAALPARTSIAGGSASDSGSSLGGPASFSSSSAAAAVATPSAAAFAPHTRSPPSHSSFTAHTTAPERWQASTHDGNGDDGASSADSMDAIPFPSHELLDAHGTAQRAPATQRAGTSAAAYGGADIVESVVSAFEEAVEISPFLVSDEEEEEEEGEDRDIVIDDGDFGKNAFNRENMGSSQSSRRKWAVPDPNTFVLPRVNMQTPQGKTDRHTGKDMP